MWRPRISASWWICTASSRVGATISARIEVLLRLADDGSRQQRLIHRNQERGRLAGAGLCLAGNIAAGQRDGQCLCLDWSAHGEARVADTLHDGRGQAEGFECRGAGLWISHQIVLYREWVGWSGLANEPRKRYKALKTADLLATPTGPHLPANIRWPQKGQYP